jgi:hypothetical protein
MSAPSSKRHPPSTAHQRCFCGAPQALELEYYCSVKCAREDALNALTRGAPYTSDRSPTPPLPTLPPDFFKPPIIGRGFTSSYGSDEGFLPHADLGPFAPCHPRSKPEAIVPRANRSKPGPGPASCSSTPSSGSDQPQWKSHYRLLREKESLHSIPDAIQQAFQAAPASAAADNPIGRSSISSSTKGNLTRKMGNDALRGSFGQPVSIAADFDSLPLQNPRKPMSSQLIISSTRVCSTSRQKSTRVSSTSSTFFPVLPPGIDWATQSPASRHRTLGSAFGRSEPSLESVRSSTPPLEHPLPPPPQHPLKGGAARLFLPLRRIGSQCSLSSHNLRRRLPHTADVDLSPLKPTPATATQASTRLGVVVRQNVLLTKRRLPIGGGPTKPSTDSNPGHSRAGGVPLFLQLPVREAGISKPPPSSAIEVEDPPVTNANVERALTSNRHCTMVPAFPRIPPSNSLPPGDSSVSVTPRLHLCPSLLLERPETTVGIVYGDGCEIDDVSSPSTSECPVTPEDSAFTLRDSRLHSSAPVECCRSERSMEESDAAIINLHRRFEGGMVLGDEATPIGEKAFAL